MLKHEGLHPLAVLLSYILLRVCMLKEVFVQKNFFEIVSQCRKLSNSAKNTLFHILIHWTELYPILIHWTELYPISKHWAELYPILIHWTELYPILIHWTEPYLNTLPSAANQFRVVSQSESSITSPQSSRLWWRSLLGSRLESARYSLS